MAAQYRNSEATLTENLTTSERIASLMDHLGLEAAHLATQIPGDAAEFVQRAEGRVGGIVLCGATRLDPQPFTQVAGRLLMIAGDKGLTVAAAERAAARLPGAQRHVLANYEAAGWSDVVADRTTEVAEAMSRFLAEVASRVSVPDASPCSGPQSGEHAGLTWRRTGQGPPLLLLPFFLAPSQWEPAVPHLMRHFTVIQVGGANIGGIAALEDRARAPTYRALFHSLIDRLAPKPDARILDVGCGSGALDRILAKRLGSSARIDAADLNPFFLAEARTLAQKNGVGDRITFVEASATSLPFPDATFDGVFSVTVLEECDADRAIAEIVRVARPGARIGIVVRAIDLDQWWNLELSGPLRAKTKMPPQSVGVGGVADRSLYVRMRRAGLVDLQAFPALITLDRSEGPMWRYREDAVLSQLTPDETAEWRAATGAAELDGVLMASHVLHAAVARKP